tara:strand:+ start:37 stop:243 length:207 start_codon:yes stop_codon:yes gene_type:complete
VVAVADKLTRLDTPQLEKDLVVVAVEPMIVVERVPVLLRKQVRSQEHPEQVPLVDGVMLVVMALVIII